MIEDSDFTIKTITKENAECAKEIIGKLDNKTYSEIAQILNVVILFLCDQFENPTKALRDLFIGFRRSQDSKQ